MPYSSLQSDSRIVSSVVYPAQHLVDSRTRATKQSVALLYRIKSVIRVHMYDPDMNLDRLAKILHCSKRSLHHAFAQEGNSVSEYLWKCRLEACRLLIERGDETSRSLTRIALDCGFSSASHFSKMFKQHYKLTPREFQKQVKKVGCHTALTTHRNAELNWSKVA